MDHATDSDVSNICRTHLLTLQYFLARDYRYAYNQESILRWLFDLLIYRIRKNIGEELNLAIWRAKTKSPIFHLTNIFCTHLTQNLAHNLSMAVVQIEQSLVKYFASMSSASNEASNTFEHRTCVHILVLIVTMVMLKYVKQEA